MAYGSYRVIRMKIFKPVTIRSSLLCLSVIVLAGRQPSRQNYDRLAQKAWNGCDIGYKVPIFVSWSLPISHCE